MTKKKNVATETNQALSVLSPPPYLRLVPFAQNKKLPPLLLHCIRHSTLRTRTATFSFFFALPPLPPLPTTQQHYNKHTASAAPIPPLLSRQHPRTYNNTYFPYDISGPVPPTLYKPGQVLDRCTKANAYAISFDDGPGQLTDELLDALEEQNLQVTFFMNGDNWSCIYRTYFLSSLLLFADEVKKAIG